MTNTLTIPRLTPAHLESIREAHRLLGDLHRPYCAERARIGRTGYGEECRACEIQGLLEPVMETGDGPGYISARDKSPGNDGCNGCGYPVRPWEEHCRRCCDRMTGDGECCLSDTTPGEEQGNHDR